MTRVLVTGATTPIGVELVRALGRDGRVTRVLAVAAPHEAPPANGDGVPCARWVKADLTRERDVRNLVFGEALDDRIDVVVHMAQHRAARDAGSRVRALNVDSTRLLLRLSERHPTIRRFVFRSSADVYRVRPEHPVILPEDHPLELSARAPQWVRDRVEADVTVGVRMGMSRLVIAVLRCAECLAPHTGSQLYDYLRSRVCFTPLGFDPMLNLLSVEDTATALRLAALSDAQGIFNIGGLDTLPLSEVVRAVHSARVPVPSSLIGPLYGLRAVTRGTDFRYDQNAFRFHFGGIVDGRRAREVLGYEPARRISWEAVRRPSRQSAGATPTRRLKARLSAVSEP